MELDTKAGSGKHAAHDEDVLDLDRQYDLSPLDGGDDVSSCGGGGQSNPRGRRGASSSRRRTPTTPSSYSIDPWEIASPEDHDREFFRSMGR